VLLGEGDAPAILRALGAYEQRVASRLARVKLRRVALRHARLGDATALRLAGAGRLDALMTYDARLAEGTRRHGLPVVARREVRSRGE